jgi:hypothetical protein
VTQNACNCVSYAGAVAQVAVKESRIRKLTAFPIEDSVRELTDIKGYRVYVESVSGHNWYSGMIEGTPYLARKLRLSMSKDVMKRPGNFVVGLPELEREIEALDKKCTEWAPREAWNARVSDGVNYRERISRVAHIHWFQEGIDPMRRLQEIVEALDFLAIAVQVKVDISD